MNQDPINPPSTEDINATSENDLLLQTLEKSNFDKELIFALPM